MSPPDKHVGVVKHLVGKTAFGIVESCGGHLNLVALKKALDIFMNSAGIILGNNRVNFFVIILVPDNYLHF
jgi:hypothetical protein